MQHIDLNIHLDDPKIEDKIAMIHAFSKLDRFKIFVCLIQNNSKYLTAKEISKKLKINEANVRFHLKVLMENKIVKGKKRYINSHVFQWEFKVVVMGISVKPHKSYLDKEHLC